MKTKIQIAIKKEMKKQIKKLKQITIIGLTRPPSYMNWLIEVQKWPKSGARK